MTQYYNITIGNSINSYTLKYQLSDNRPARVWANIMSNCDVSNLRKGFFPWKGIMRDWNLKANELNTLIDDINKWIPNLIPGLWNEFDIQESLNRLHIHFPEQEKVETDSQRLTQLTRYNDLIHELESMYKIKSQDDDPMHLTIFPDSGNWEKVLLEDDDYEHFQMSHSFGNLMLAYPHVGRHPLEIFSSNDINCPTDQILCQFRIGSLHYLHFHDRYVDQKKFDEFYTTSGINWPFSLNNPKLAAGFIKLGSLISVNDNEYTREIIYDMVRSCNLVLNWTITDY